VCIIREDSGGCLPVAILETDGEKVDIDDVENENHLIVF
jgi:hypothetical protein